jgi:hypothetical protein
MIGRPRSTAVALRISAGSVRSGRCNGSSADRRLTSGRLPGIAGKVGESHGGFGCRGDQLCRVGVARMGKQLGNRRALDNMAGMRRGQSSARRQSTTPASTPAPGRLSHADTFRRTARRDRRQRAVPDQGCRFWLALHGARRRLRPGHTLPCRTNTSSSCLSTGRIGFSAPRGFCEISENSRPRISSSARSPARSSSRPPNRMRPEVT